jgi:hypothetical protein
VVSGSDARVLRMLADERHLSATSLRRMSPGAAQSIEQWLADGWLEAVG